VNKTFSELVEREAAKRDRNWHPRLRWQVLQQTIAWVNSQSNVRRNTKEACLANQQRLLEQIEAYRLRELRHKDEPAR
jgi:hypothetical protein